MALQAKRLSYRVVEVMPGIGQLKIFRLSGQKQVPVMVDGENVIADSSEIIEYLEEQKPGLKLLPDNPQEALQAHLIEDWADTTFAKSTQKALLREATINPELRVALLPEETPSSLKQLANRIPSLDMLSELSNLIGHEEGSSIMKNLEKLSLLIDKKQWLVGDSISIADLAVAAQLSLLKFPTSSGKEIAGKGCKGFSDNPKFDNLFIWRDKLELFLMEASNYND